MNIQDIKPILIFSVFELGNSTHLNISNTDNVCKMLEENSIPYKLLDGVYKGSIETSVLVTYKHIKLVESLCKDYKQDCFLYSDEFRSSALIYKNNKIEHIGKLTAIPKNIADKLESYTYDSSEGLYWACL
jgi:hypothetical protein